MSPSKEGFEGALGFRLGIRKYVCIVLIYCNHNFFQDHKIILTLFNDCLYSGGDIYMIPNKDNIQNCRWSLCTGIKSSWRVGQQFLFLVNGLRKLICWPTGQPIGQWVDSFTKSNPLANRLTCWPRTPTCWPTGRPVGQHLIIGGWVTTDSFGGDLLPVTDTLQRALVIEAMPIYQYRVLLLSILSYGYAANNHAQIAPFFTLNS